MFSQPAAVCLRKLRPRAKCVIEDSQRRGKLDPTVSKQNWGCDAQLPVDMYSLYILICSIGIY